MQVRRLRADPGGQLARRLVAAIRDNDERKVEKPVLQLARWFAVAVVGLNAIGQMFFIPAYPFWSLMIIAVDIVALWALCAYGSRENLGVA